MSLPFPQIVRLASSYKEAIELQTCPRVSGLVGRLIRGTKPEHFETLTDVPLERRIIQLTDSTGLQELLTKKDTRAKLNHVGWSNEFINEKVASGHQFKIVVFPEQGTPAKRAFWLEQLQVVGEAWPELHPLMSSSTAITMLRKWPFEYWDAQVRCLPGLEGGISKIPVNHPLRDMASGMSALKIRIFLYFSAQLKELFSGDGFTWNADGTRGLPEYTMANRRIADIPEAAIVDLPPV